ncbi:Na+/H+ antiporter NhaA [Rhizobium leguminosarum]|uniref:Na+/H+ antiporter NhaA n=1 Tax=Rhizobium leguminosarum TaxID=384 RepID=UPI003CCB49CC
MPAALRACMFASGFHASLAGIDTTTSEPYMIASNFPQIVCFGSRYLILPLFALANAGCRNNTCGLGRSRAVDANDHWNLFVDKLLGIMEACGWHATANHVGYA